MSEGNIKLTKAQVMAGKDLTKEIEVKAWGGTVIIRPLTEKQYAQVESIKVTGTHLKGGAVYDEDGNVDKEKSAAGMQAEIDLEKTTYAEFEANATAVFYGMAFASGEKLDTVEEAMDLTPPGVIKEIARAIYEISGVTSKEAAETLKKFRDKPGRTANSDPAPKRTAAGS
jgi:hypothetical protein